VADTDNTWERQRECEIMTWERERARLFLGMIIAQFILIHTVTTTQRRMRQRSEGDPPSQRKRRPSP
jgi:hypothetical protein